MIRIGVTGTDTGVGKSVVSAALASLLRRRGLRVGAMKPVETGLPDQDPSSDAVLLRDAAGEGDPLDVVRPVRLDEPLAPWVAAGRAGTAVDLAVLDAAFARVAEGRDAVVVEGAGGLLVPITRDVAFDSLFVAWELDVIVVAGNRLGVLNHALLTVRAAHDAGLRVRGVVLNALRPPAGDVAEDSNLAALRELLAPVPVLPFPWVGGSARDPARLGEAAEQAGLGALVAERRTGTA